MKIFLVLHHTRYPFIDGDVPSVTSYGIFVLDRDISHVTSYGISVFIWGCSSCYIMWYIQVKMGMFLELHHTAYSFLDGDVPNLILSGISLSCYIIRHICLTWGCSSCYITRHIRFSWGCFSCYIIRNNPFLDRDVLRVTSNIITGSDGDVPYVTSYRITSNGILDNIRRHTCFR